MTRLPIRHEPSELSPSAGLEAVWKVFASEIRKARKARRLAFKAGKDHIRAVEYWEQYMAALMRFRTVLKAEVQ